MFIPTWLLVLIAVIAVSVFLPGMWDELRTIALMLFVLLGFISFLATLYFGYRRDTQATLLVSLPLIAMAVWGLWLTTLEGVQTSFWLHQMRVRVATTPEAVEKLRRSFADAQDLGRKLFQFHEDISHFPSWLTTTNADGTPWTSNAIRQDEIRTFHAVAQTVDIGIDPALLDHSNGECLVYTFDVDGTPFVFCSRRGDYSMGVRDDTDGESLSQRMIWVIETPNHVVLKADVSYYMDVSNTFHDAYLHAFKPGSWMSKLLDTASRVHQDEQEKHERWRKQWERERAEKNFK